MNMGTHIPTEGQYNAFVTYFTNYLVKVQNIRSSDASYLTVMRNFEALIGRRISNGRTLRPRGGSKNTRRPSKTRHDLVVRRILEERHDRQPFGITYKVRGHLLIPDNDVIGTVIFLAMTAAGTAMMIFLDRKLWFHQQSRQFKDAGTVLWVLFGFLLCFSIAENYKFSKPAQEVAWIRDIVEKMIREETNPAQAEADSTLTTVAQRMHRFSPSLFPTYNRYTQIMQVVIRESMQMHHRDDGVDEQRLCIIATACLAGIVARKLLQPLQPRLTHHMGVKVVGRLGTIHRVLKMLDNAAKSRTSYVAVRSRTLTNHANNKAEMFPFFKDPFKVTTGTSS